jgi:hypothetical protein
VQSSNEYSVVWGLAVFAVMGVFILVLRWAYSDRKDSLLSRRPRTGKEHEYGLLVPLAAPANRAEGQEIAAKLQAAGIRAALVATQDGLRVMVWPEDLARARDLLLHPPDDAPA